MLWISGQGRTGTVVDRDGGESTVELLRANRLLENGAGINLAEPAKVEW